MKFYKVKIPLYQGTLTIIKTDDLEKVSYKYKLISLHGVDACAFRTYKKNGAALYFLAFEKKVTPGIIAHESLHLVGLIYEDIHAILDIENDEPQCYLIEWIVDECHKFLKI